MANEKTKRAGVMLNNKKIQYIPYKIDENTTINVKYIDGEPLLTAEQIAKIYGISTEEVEKIIKEIYEDYELDPNACTRFLPENLELIEMPEEEKKHDLLEQMMQVLGYKQI